MTEVGNSKYYLRIAQAHNEYNLGIPLLRKLIRKGSIPSVRPAGARIVLIPRRALDELMAESTRSAAKR